MPPGGMEGAATAALEEDRDSVAIVAGYRRVKVESKEIEDTEDAED